LGFIGKKYRIIENKLALREKISMEKKNQIPEKLIYTGTISSVYGTLEALNWAIRYQEIVPNARLLVLGVCKDKKYEKKLRNLAKNHAFIDLVISENPVEHLQIIENMKKSDLALLSYQENKSTQNCIPSKIYECIAYQLPMLIQKNSFWQENFEQWNCGIFIDFKVFDADLVKNFENYFFYQKPVPKSVWCFDSSYFKKIIERIC